MKTFKAPWPVSLHLISWVATIIVVVAAILGSHALRQRGFVGITLLLPKIGGSALIFGAALFTVRAYAVTADAILVRRLFWWTRIPREELSSAEIDPDAITWKTIRTFGNGGFYSFTGWFWNKRIGSFRAFITDASRCVVLRFETKTILVSPDNPDAFVKALGPSAIALASQAHEPDRS